MRLVFSKNDTPWRGVQAGEEYLRKIERDLELSKLAASISLEGRVDISSREILNMMTTDPDEIAARQMISLDLMENDDFFNSMLSLHSRLGGLYDIASDVNGTLGKDVNNYIVIMKWVDIYVSVVLELDRILSKYKGVIKSSALSELQKKISELTGSKEFFSIRKNSNDMKMEHLSLKGARLGVNLNAYMEPVSLCCLDVNPDYYYPRKIIGSKGNSQKTYGISKFIYKPRGKNTQAGLRYDESQPEVVLISTNRLQRMVSCEVDIEFINALGHYFSDLNFNSRTLVRTFIRDNVKFILDMFYDLGFFLGAVSFARKLRVEGLEVCLPCVATGSENEYAAYGLYNSLLFSDIGMQGENIIKNDVILGTNSSFAVLNGPNRGGKTTMVQAVALSLVMFQLGVYVPCTKACIKPADIILTHYQREESGAIKGRLATEADSMRTILEIASPESFVILNEPFVSTSPSEGMILIMNSLYGIREMGCRGFLVTHYHRLNDGIDEENMNSIHKIKFLHMGIEKGGEKRTFVLENGRGSSASFAMDILNEYAPVLIER